MILLYEKLGLIFTSSFCSCCLYISLIEHPARMLCSPGAALKQWQHSYPRAATLQVGSLILGTIFLILSFFSNKNPIWLFAALLLFISFPYTTIFLMPINKQLSKMEDEKLAIELLNKWGKGHFFRGVFSLLSLLIILWQL